jgi:hypothetical protein
MAFGSTKAPSRGQTVTTQPVLPPTLAAGPTRASCADLRTTVKAYRQFLQGPRVSEGIDSSRMWQL